MLRRATTWQMPALLGAGTRVAMLQKGTPETNEESKQPITTSPTDALSPTETAIAATESAHKAALQKKLHRDDNDKQLSFRKAGAKAPVSFTEADRRLSIAHMQKPSVRSRIFESSMLLLVLGGGGFMAYNYVTYQGPRFDQPLVRAKLRDVLERRPDLAPTFIRTAFILAAKRADVMTDLIGESCACEAGLDEVMGILENECTRSTISTNDAAVLAALESISLLAGPKGKNEIPFRWNRWDLKPPPTEAEKEAEKLLAQEKEAQQEDSKQQAAPAAIPESVKEETPKEENNKKEVRTPRLEAGVLNKAQKARVRRDDIIAWSIKKGEATPTIEEYLKETKRSLKSIDEILTAIDPTFTVQEKVALLGCHGIGEYHPDVSGFDGTSGLMKCAYTRREQFTLDNHYYKRLLEFEGKWAVMPKPEGRQRNINDGSEDVMCPVMKSVWVTPPNKDNGAKRKRRQLAVTAREEEAILRNPEWRAEAVKFAADNKVFHQALSSAFQKMVESQFGDDTLREYPAELA